MTATDQMMQNEIAKSRRPKRPLVIAGSVLGLALLVGGGVAGANAVNSFRADVAQSEAAAKGYYEAAQEQAAIAAAASDDADEAVVAAGEAVTAAEANEAAIAAQVAADQAAAAAAEAARVAAESDDPDPSGPSPRTNLPAGATVPLNEFGSPDTTKCASGSASDDSSGTAICD